MKKLLSLSTFGLLALLVVGCGGTSSSISPSTSQTPSTSTGTSTSTGSSSVDTSVLTNKDFEKAKTTYIDDDGQEKELNMNTLYTNDGAPHLDSQETLHALVVPFGFTDTSLQSVQTQENIDRIKLSFFGSREELEAAGGWMSVADYYKTSSFGDSDFEGEVLNTWVTYPGTADAFKTANLNNTGIGAATYIRNWYLTEYAKEGHGQLGADAHPLSWYDANQDGFLDLVWIVYSHPTVSGDTNNWWAYVTYTMAQKPTDITNPVVQTLGWASIDWLNKGFNGYDPHTFIHETGHTYGLDDYYDYTNSWSPMGKIDMMDNNLGDHSAFSKFCLGWVNPLVVDIEKGEKAVITLYPTTTSGDCFILPSQNYNGTAFDEYIMVELMAPYGIIQERDYTAGYQNVNGYSEAGIRISHVDARVYNDNHDEYLTTNPQDGIGYRVCNTKGGRQGYKIDSDYWPRDNGTKQSYTLTSIFESYYNTSKYTLNAPDYGASNSSLFGEGDVFTLNPAFGWGKNFMPSGSNLWNKAKTTTGWQGSNQTYEIDETMTCDYYLTVLSIEEDAEHGYVAQVQVEML